MYAHTHTHTHTHTYTHTHTHTHTHTQTQTQKHRHTNTFNDLLERVGVGQCNGKDRQVLLIVEVGVQLGQTHNT